MLSILGPAPPRIHEGGRIGEGMKTVSIKGNTLKMIAVVTMIIDHIGASILQLIMAENKTLGIAVLGIQTIVQLDGTDRTLAICWWVMRMVIGRIAFPIYCFLLVEGFLHTRSVMKYGTRLLLFALISEIPFDLAIFHGWYDTHRQNVFFTLLFGLIGMWGISVLEQQINRIKNRRSEEASYLETGRMLAMFLGIFILLAGVLGAAELLRTDYGARGVGFILLLYLLRREKTMQLAVGCVGSMLVLDELAAPLAFIPIAFYKGERGGRGRLIYYAIYPLHLLLLYGVSLCF